MIENMELADCVFKAGGMYNVSPTNTVALCNEGKAILVDVREPYLNRHKRFGVKHVVYIPLSELKYRYPSLPGDHLILFADSVGLRSGEAVRLLMEKGYENVANVAGGLVQWERDGCPVVVDPTRMLTGSCMCQLKPRNKKT